MKMNMKEEPHSEVLWPDAGTIRESRILACFFLLCSLLTNKYLLQAFYSSTGTFRTPWVNGVVWLNTAFWVITGILAWKNKLHRHRVLANVLFAIAAFAILFQMLVLVDRTMLPLLIKIPEVKTRGLIFEPHSKVRYKSSEFECDVEVNSLGIRDHEYPLAKQRKYRILAFGDSFTFGWGVDIDASWPKVLERTVRSNGVDAEVLNFGQPGTWSKQYLDHIQEAVPLLKPDLIIVGLLQGDDLAQKYFEVNWQPDALDLRSNSKREPKKVRFDIVGLLERFPTLAFPNVSALLVRRATSQPMSLHEQWLKESRELLHRWKGLAKARYELLVSDSVKSMFESGNLNPGLVQGGVEFPDAARMMGLQDPKTLKAISAMESDLRAIKSICDKGGASVVVISIPGGPSVSPDAVRYKDMGYFTCDVRLSNVVDSSADSVYRSLAEHIGAPFFEFTNQFRHYTGSTTLFYRFDGHLTPAGHKLLGESLGSSLESSCFKPKSIPR
jgi:hypothetical protein